MEVKWFEDYFALYKQSIFSTEINDKLAELKECFVSTQAKGRKIIILGNGGSAAIASHTATDLSKNARIRATCFNNSELITCLSNDYGYSQWMAKALELYGDRGDTVILISSSGVSENIHNAARVAKARDMTIVTFSGFSPDNPLRQKGTLNFWLDSRAYNIVEMTHQIWLLAVCDAIIGSAEYPAS